MGGRKGCVPIRPLDPEFGPNVLSRRFLGSLIRTEGHSFSGSVNNVAASLLLTWVNAEISSLASAATPGTYS